MILCGLLSDKACVHRSLAWALEPISHPVLHATLILVDASIHESLLLHLARIEAGLVVRSQGVDRWSTVQQMTPICGQHFRSVKLPCRYLRASLPNAGAVVIPTAFSIALLLRLAHKDRLILLASQVRALLIVLVPHLA